MGRGKAIGDDAREVIYKVYLYFAIEAEKFRTDDGYFQRIQQRVANATGVSLKFVYLLLKDKGKYNSEEYTMRQETTLKRKLDDNEESDTFLANYSKNIPAIEKVYVKSMPIEIQTPQDKPKKSLLESVLTSPYPSHQVKANNFGAAAVNTGPRIIKVHSLAPQAPQTQTETSILPTTQVSTIPIASNSMPTLIKVHQPKSTQALSPVPTTVRVRSTPQALSPVPSTVRVRAITQNAVPKPVLASVSTVVSHKPRAPGPEFIKVYPIPRDQVPKKVLEKADKATNKHNIEIKTVPIEFDPGSFGNEIKTEPEDSISD